MDPELSSRKSKVRGGVISSARRHEEIRAGNPSPNQYTPNIDSIKPEPHRGNSIGRASLDRGEIIPYGKLGFAKIDKSPQVGPGSYSDRIDHLKPNAPALTISKASRVYHKVEHGPGVGKYYPNDALLRKIPSAVICVALDLRKQQSQESPGPG